MTGRRGTSPDISDLSASAQNHLKVIWSLQEWSGTPVTASVVAERLGLRLSTVSDALRRLTEQGLVEHEPYGSVALTSRGRDLALAMVRRHRLIETFLVRMLHYSWDEVHEEAEHLEHAVSDLMVERIDALLGHPRRDPHGDPIPSPDGTTHRPDAVPLDRVEPGCVVRVERISDADSGMLQYFADRGIVLDAELAIAPAEPYSEAVMITVAGSTEPVRLGAAAAEAIWVSG